MSYPAMEAGGPPIGDDFVARAALSAGRLIMWGGAVFAGWKMLPLGIELMNAANNQELLPSAILRVAGAAVSMASVGVSLTGGKAADSLGLDRESTLNVLDLG